MAVTNPATKSEIVTLDGVVTRLPIEFDYRDASHVKLRIIDSAGIAGDVTQGESEDFTVDLATDEVVLNDPYLEGSPFQDTYQALVYRDVPSTREVDFVQLGRFNPDVLDDDLDRAVMRDQQIVESSERSIQLDITDSGGSLILPTTTARANTFLSFDSDGNIETSPGPAPRQWNQFFEYEQGAVDVISYQGQIYKLIVATDTGTEPGTDSSIWEPLVDHGVWTADVTYPVGALVSYSGSLFVALLENKAQTPAGGTSDTNWDKINTAGSSWDSSVIYSTNNIVERNGVLYRSLADNNSGNDPELTLDVSWEEVKTGGGVDADIIAGEDITVSGNPLLVQIDSDGKAYKADKSSPLPVIGFVSATVLADAGVRSFNQGLLEGFTGLTVGSTYYMGSNGAISVGDDIGFGDYQVEVGFAMSATTLFVQLRKVDPITGYDSVPISQVAFFAAATAPTGWLACQGQAVSRVTYSRLFQKIGTTFGVGDGLTTFNLPDPREAALIATGTNGTHTIAESNPLALGDFQDDQLENIDVQLSNGSSGFGSMFTGSPNNIAGWVKGVSTGSLVTKQRTLTDLGTAGRTGTTTHGKQFGLLACIKALEVTGAGDLVLSPVPQYDSGWIFNNDWTGRVIPVDYSSVSGLQGMTLADLDVDFLISKIGDDSDTFDLKLANNSSASAGPRGVTFQQTDTDEISIYTGDNGILYISEINTAAAIDTETWYYRVIIRPKVHNDLAILQNNGGYNQELVFDISAADQVVDLTPIYEAIDGYRVSYAWTGGDGTFQLSFDGGTYTGKTIGGVSADALVAQMKGDGIGRLTLIKDGNDLRLESYHDSDGGNFTDKWEKDAGGNLEMSTHLTGYVNIGGGGAAADTWTFEIQPIAADYNIYGTTPSPGGVIYLSGTPTTTSVNVGIVNPISATYSGPESFPILKGRWTNLYPQSQIRTEINGIAFELNTNGQLGLAPPPVYDSGWVANSDWTNAVFTANYGSIAGLSGKTLPELNVSYYNSADGTDANAIDMSTGFGTSTSSSYGHSVHQAGVDTIVVNTGATGDVYITYPGGSSAGLTSQARYYRIVITPKVHTDLAIIQNNGGYDFEGVYDISTTNAQVDLTAMYDSLDGTIYSYKWTGGDGTAQITFGGGTYTGKTIGGVDADTLAADLAGDGQGRITFRKDGNNLRILAFTDSDGGNFGIWSWNKTAEGLQYEEIFTNNQSSFAFILPFVAQPIATATPSDAASRVVQLQAIDATTIDLNTYRPDNLSATTNNYSLALKGRWTAEYPEVG
jgi:microcystin-dependent protein